MSFTHSTSAQALRRVAIFAAVLVMSMANVETMWGAGTSITVYSYGAYFTTSGGWDYASSTMKIAVRLGSGDWLDGDMTPTGTTYLGFPVYSYTFTEKNGGAEIYFKNYVGGERESYHAMDGDWMGTSALNGKMYLGWSAGKHNWVAYSASMYPIYLDLNQFSDGDNNWTTGSAVFDMQVDSETAVGGVWIKDKLYAFSCTKASPSKLKFTRLSSDRSSTWNTASNITYSSSYNTYKITGWNAGECANDNINLVTKTTRVYYDNSSLRIDDNGGSALTYKYLVIGHDNFSAYSKTYDASATVSNTKLLYYEISSDVWRDATFYGFVGSGSSWGAGSWGSSNLKNASKYTAAYKSQYDFKTGHISLFVPASGSSGAALTATDKGTAASSMNTTQTFNYALSTDNGSTYTTMTSGAVNTPGQLSLASYKFVNGTYNSVSANTAQTLSANATTYTKSLNTVAYTGTTTLTESNTRNGYTFMGWYSGSSQRTNGSTHTYTYYPKADSTLTARYKANQYTVTLNNQGADTGHEGTTSVTMTFETTSNISGYQITLPEKTGYTFNGYYDTEECDGTWIIKDDGYFNWDGTYINSTSGKWQYYTDDVDLYAKWTEDTHTVGVAKNINAAGTINTTSVSGVGIATASSTITAAPYFGYRFTGWTIPSGVTIASGTSSSTSITINATADSKTITANFVREYAFIEGNFAVQNSSRGSETKTGDSWQDNSTAIQMEYDGTNHRFYLHTYRTPEELAEQVNSADAYFYVKTSTSSSSIENGVKHSAYTSGSSNQDLSAYGSSNKKATGTSANNFRITGTEDAYAILYINSTHIWYELECALSYYGNGGTGDAPEARTYYAYGSEQTAATNSYSRTGYTFDKWNTAADGSGTPYDEGVDVEMNAAEVCLSAQWTENTYNVTAAYGAGGSAATPSSATSMGEVTGGDITATAATGYTFSTWSVTSGSGSFGSATSASTKFYPTAASTVTASFTANVYTVEEHNNGGRIWSDSIENYTYGEGATLPTDVTKWGYRFDGWYEDNKFTEGPITTIGTSETGDKEYWAKWTSISDTLLAASGHPEFYAAEEGDILVITVTDVQPSAQIFLANTSSVEIDHKSISATGKYAFQLSASAATALHTGVIITGVNYTKSSVALLYKKTIWNDGLEVTTSWGSTGNLGHTGFEDIAEGDYLGFTVSAINSGSYHQYVLQYNWTSKITGGVETTGTYLEEIDGTLATNLAEGEDAVSLGAAYLTLSELNRYLTTRDYTITLNDNSGSGGDGTHVVTYNSATGSLTNVPTRTGYTFGGYWTGSGGDGTQIFNADKTPISSVSGYTDGSGNWIYVGDVTLYAKWTEIARTISSDTDRPLKTVSEGDLLVINVATVCDNAQIIVKNYAGDATLFTKEISATGKYTFQLSSSDASALHTGVTITGTNYTYTYQLLYKKTLWSGTLVSPLDDEPWQTANLDRDDLTGIEDGDFVGFTVSAINSGEFHQYSLCAYENPTTDIAANNTTSTTGTFVESIKSGEAAHLLDEGKSVFIAAQYLTITGFHRYVEDKEYPITYYDADTTEISTLLPNTYTFGEGAILPTVVTTKTGYTFDGWLKYGSDRRVRTQIDDDAFGDYKFIATWKQTLTLNMQGVGSTPVATVMYDSTSLASYTPGATFRDGVLLGYYTDATDGTKVLNADGTFAATNVTDYIVGGRWRKAGATTLYAHWDATISLPDTLRKSNYIAIGGGLTLVDDTLNYNTGSNKRLDGYAEWQANMVQAVYNVTIKGNYDGTARTWQLSLINKAGTVDSTCTFTKIWETGDKTESKQWNLSGIDPEGEYVIRLMNLTEWGKGKVLYVAMDPITVTYDANGGSCATETAIYAGSALTLPTPTLSGYVFEGWYSGGTKIGNAGGSYVPTASITLTAKWGIITALPDTLTKENVGDYSSDMEWTGDDEEYFDYGSEDKENLGRWAKWEVSVVPCKYNIAWVSDYNVSEAIKWGLILFDGPDTVATYIPASTTWSKKEYTYPTQWDLTKDKSGEDLVAGTYTLEVKNMQSYARPKLKSLVLTPDFYTITYDAGEYGSGSIAAGKKIGCHNFTLSSSTFTRAGYEQDGWATSDGGSKAYNLGATYSTDAALTLYPHWTCATPPDPTGFAAGTITDGGVTFTIEDDADAASYEIYYSTSSTAPTAETVATTTSTAKTKEVTGLTAGTTYYAWVRAVCDGSHKSDWVALDDNTFMTNYTITMGDITTHKRGDAAVGGETASDVSHAAEGATVTLTATPASGYGFVAWKIEKTSDNSDITDALLGADSTSVNPSFTMPAYGVTVKATFATRYTIAYKAADRTTTIPGMLPTYYLYGVGVESLPTPPDSTGYTFDGWYLEYCVVTEHSGSWDSDCKKTRISTTSYGSIVYLAKYDPNTYTITLNGNGGTGNTTSVTATYDSEALSASITNPTRTCYTFAGWNTKSDGSGDDVIGTDGKLNTSITGYTDGEGDWIAVTDTTLYARWTQDNLALNKTPVAGYTPSNPDEAPAKLTDGSTSTAWTTYNQQDASVEWFYVDLGDVYQLSRIEAVWGDVYSTDYILQTSHSAPANSSAAADDSKWYTVAEVTDATGSATKTTSIDVAARYVRLHSLTRSGEFLRLYEFRVFGTGAADKDDTAPVINTATFKTASTGQNAAQFDVTFTEAVTAAADIHWTVVDKNSVSHAATYSDGVLSVTGLPTDANQSVTIYGMDEAANISDGKVVSSISYVNPTENLALNKTSYACIDYNDSEGKEQANDGDTDTYMTTYTYATESNEWWYVDLGAFFDIRRIEVVWMENYASASYSVQYRQNAPAGDSGATSSEWDAISEFTTVTTGDKSADIASSVSARYICLRSTSHGSTHTEQNRLAEVRVFGSAFGTPDEDAPEWTDANCAVTSAEDHTITMTLEAVDAVDGDIYDFVINIDNGTTDKDYERSTMTPSNVIEIEDASMIQPCVTYTITAKCKDHVGNEATKVFSDVTTSISDGTNLALSKTATAGTSENVDHQADKAVDGKTNTEWSGNSGEKEGGVNQWLKVDLGTKYDIDSIKISWGANAGTRPQDYKIQVSYDGTNFRTIVHRESADGTQDNKYLDLDAKGRYVRVWADVYGNLYGMCITELEVYGGCYSEGETTYLFTGQNATSTTWSTAANWDIGEVPTSEKDVVLVAPAEVDVTNAAAKSVVIDQTGSRTGKLTIAANKALVVEGKVTKTIDDGKTLSATEAADLKIESSSDGNGTLIFTNDGNAATVELYSIGSTLETNWTWQYIGVPFTSVDPQASYYGGYLYKWENNQWNTVHKDDNLTAFTGYSVSYPAANHKYVMDGTLAPTTEQVITVPASSYMVIGNSWTAPIYVKGFTSDDFGSIYTKSVYLFNTGSHTSGAETWAGSGTRYNAGTYVAIPINAAGITGDSLIAPLQGFYVDNTTGSATTFTMNYDNLVRPEGNRNVVAGRMHAPRRAEAEEQPVVLKMWASGTNYDDRLILIEREDFTTEYDAGWDGEKWDAPGKQPMLYTTRPDGTTDAVSALPELDGTIIGFRAGEDNTYTLRFEYAEDNDDLYILDTRTGASTQVLSGNTYTFTADDTEAHARFLLTRNNAPQITTGNANANANAEKATKLILDQKLYIYLNGILYDATGRRVDSFSVGSGFDANANANANAEQEKGGAE